VKLKNNQNLSLTEKKPPSYIEKYRNRNRYKYI
jgi:hypothetical protein